MSTSLNDEREAQRLWQLLPQWRHVGIFDRLVEDEFLPVEEFPARTAVSLQNLARHVESRVPFYARAFQDAGIHAGDIVSAADLPRLPVLTKRDVHEHAAELLVSNPGEAEKPKVVTFSSGTTGQPTRVYQTALAWQFFSFLKQRQYRWSRYDPRGTMAAIRLPSQLPSADGDAVLDIGQTAQIERWRQVGVCFETGPFLGYSVLNSVEDQIAWIEEKAPDYLIAYPETLELLAMTLGDRSAPPSLRGMQAISEQMTGSMRRRIEGTFGVHVDQNYGLNEVGLVACRCREGGRYHVNVENYVVEIVDDDGMPVGPGEVGRILVTVMNNRFMPLVRYDTDDLARAVDGPCPCGRTLPAFADVVGRYSRIAFLPEGTLPLVGVLRDTIADLVDECGRALRQFQVHQFRDDRFELRLLGVEPLPEAFTNALRAAWDDAAGPAGPRLAIVQVDEIKRSAGGKHQDFTSDYFPDPGSDAAPGA